MPMSEPRESISRTLTQVNLLALNRGVRRQTNDDDALRPLPGSKESSMGILDKVAEIAVGATLALALGACTITPWRALDDGEAEPEASAPAADSAARPPAVTAAAADVPSGFYRVKSGDTLYAVAKANGQHPADLMNWNKLPADGKIEVGQLLRVAPASSPTPTPTPTAAAVAPAPAVQKAAQPPRPASAPAAAATAPAAASAPKEAAKSHHNSRLIWPIEGSLAQPFKAKSKGVVIAGPAGQQVKAAASGRVVYAGNGLKAYGNLVILKHDTHLITAYGQNGKLLVKQGEAVKQGQAIAVSGTDDAGISTLMFEVRFDGKPVDPLAWLPTAQPSSH
jgi:lipoprotein NlpD